jgi:hypothetical protein
MVAWALAVNAEHYTVILDALPRSVRGITFSSDEITTDTASTATLSAQSYQDVVRKALNTCSTF